MPVEAAICPNCGAPLELLGNKCKFCAMPLMVTATTGPQPMAAPPVAPQVGDKDGAFAMTVDDVFSIRGRGTVVTGQIQSGSIRVGDPLLIHGAAGARKTVCTAIEMFRKKLDEAAAGDNVGLMLKGIGKDDVARGDQLRATG